MCCWSLDSLTSSATLDRFLEASHGARARSLSLQASDIFEPGGSVFLISLARNKAILALPDQFWWECVRYRTNSDKRHLRPVVLGERLMVVKGRWPRQGEVCDIIAGHLEV